MSVAIASIGRCPGRPAAPFDFDPPYHFSSSTYTIFRPLPYNVSRFIPSANERQAIKPDGVQRGLVGPIISRFENKGFKLSAIKMTQPGQEHLEKHYSDLSDKPFFRGLISCTSITFLQAPKQLLTISRQT